VPGSGGTMTGSFVYVIEGHAGHHKIGVSRDPIQRLAELQTGSLCVPKTLSELMT
jgi:predicted GIY-YIG superfamily endonuclease